MEKRILFWFKSLTLFWHNILKFFYSENNIVWKMAMFNKRKDEEIRFYQENNRNLEGQIDVLLNFIEKISDEALEIGSKVKQLEEKIEIDFLTGCLNARAMNRVMKTRLSEKIYKETVIALYFIDLDNFKLVNSLLGHKGADVILRKISKILRKVFFRRKLDVVARPHGDEFLVMSEYETMNHAIRAFESFKKIGNISKVFKGLVEINFGASIGVCFIKNSSEIEGYKSYSSTYLKVDSDGIKISDTWEMELNNKWEMVPPEADSSKLATWLENQADEIMYRAKNNIAHAVSE